MSKFIQRRILRMRRSGEWFAQNRWNKEDKDKEAQEDHEKVVKKQPTANKPPKG